MKTAKLLTAIALVLVLVGCTNTKQPSLPSRFSCKISSDYDSNQITINADYSQEKMILEFLSPEKFTIEIAGNECVLSAGKSKNLLSFDKLPEKGFAKLAISAIKSCFSPESILSKTSGDYFIFLSNTYAGEAELSVNKNTLMPEKIEIKKMNFSLSFSDFKEEETI